MSKKADSDIVARIHELRNDDYSNPDVANIIEQEFGTKIEPEDIDKVLNRGIARGIVNDQKAAKIFERYEKLIGQRYGKAVKMIDWLIEAVEKIKDEFDSSDKDQATKYLSFIKLAPTITSLSKEILAQIDFIKKQQEQIKIEQKNIIYSPMQINYILQNQLKDLAKQGYIRILKTLPEEKKKKKEEKEREMEEEIENN